MRNNSDRVAVPTRYLTRENYFRAQDGAMFSRENKNTFCRRSPSTRAISAIGAIECAHYMDDLLPHAPLVPCSYWGYGQDFINKQ